MKVSYVIVACYPDKGMKSYGSKSLITFGKKKLIDYQLELISNNKLIDYEIIIISNFDTNKLEKLFSSIHKIKIVSLEEHNPIYAGCINSKYENVIFIDYGCLLNNKHVFKKMIGSSSVICTDKNSVLDIGCVTSDNKLEHIFFDLPENKFCKIFSLCSEDKKRVIKYEHNFNLLPFEIINNLIDKGSIFLVDKIKSEDFIYFNHMRQKNDINKFIKKIHN